MNMKREKKVGIVCCSNGQKKAAAPKIEQLKNTLLELGLSPTFGDCIYEKEDIFSGTAKERADALVKFYRDDEITEIFDISGGDVANGILPYLDYDVIKNSEKRFWGYSDLTTVLNAIYAKTGKASILYQVRNLLYKHREQQIADFRNTLIEQGNDLFQLKYEFIQGQEMHGVVVGGNIRCFLKLAGTRFDGENIVARELFWNCGEDGDLSLAIAAVGRIFESVRNSVRNIYRDGGRTMCADN